MIKTIILILTFLTYELDTNAEDSEFDLIPVPLGSVQKNLKRLGFDNVQANGKLDQNTKNAITALSYLTSDETIISNVDSNNSLIISSTFENNLMKLNKSSIKQLVERNCKISIPNFPRKALMMGIEGSVTVNISIDMDGQARDAVVLAANPANLFDSATIKAANKIRCSKPKEKINLSYTYDFKLNS